MSNTSIILQARTGSTRLPFKVLYPIDNIPVISVILKKCLSASFFCGGIKTILVTSNKPTDNILEYYAQLYNADFYRGSEEDVLDRFYQAAKTFNIDTIIRITADCPLTNPAMIIDMLSRFRNLDYFSNCHPERTVPKGLDIEIFTFEALKKAWKETKSSYDREHVTPFLYNSGKFKLGTYYPNKKYNIKENYSIDTIEDYLRIKDGKLII